MIEAQTYLSCDFIARNSVHNFSLSNIYNARAANLRHENARDLTPLNKRSARVKIIYGSPVVSSS